MIRMKCLGEEEAIYSGMFACILYSLECLDVSFIAVMEYTIGCLCVG